MDYINDVRCFSGEIWMSLVFSWRLPLFIYLEFYLTFNTSIGHIMTDSFVGQRKPVHTIKVKDLYCNVPTIGKEPPTFPHKVWSSNCQPQRWEGSILPLHHHGSSGCLEKNSIVLLLFTATAAWYFLCNLLIIDISLLGIP